MRGARGRARPYRASALGVSVGRMPLDLDTLYRDLHSHPELSFAETRTAGIAAARLRELGLDVTEGVGRTGVVGVLANGAGPVVHLRADMDALPVTEATGLDYASTQRAVGPDGVEVGVMHACGHDMHVTWLLGAIERLVATRDEWSGTIVAVFQPAEETIGGAREMVADGLVDRFPRADVVLGQHLAPLPAGVASVTSGPAMAGADTLTITMHGRGGHGSRPQSTIDPVLAAASAVVRLQSIVSREVAPGALAVVTVGSLHAGTKSNIIPAEATMGVSVRSVDADVRSTLLDGIRRIVEAEATASGMTEPPTVVVDETVAATVNDADATARVRAALEGRFGAETVIDIGTLTGSEDVHELATAAGAPLVYWFVGGVDPETFARAAAAGRVEQEIPTNHSPFFAPVLHPTIEHGVETLVTAAMEWVGRS